MDGQAQVRLVFAGETIEGHAPDEVQRLFGQLFKLEGERLAAVFSGKRTVLKREIGREDGERYVARLRKIGMRVLIEPLDSPPSAPKPLASLAGAAPPMPTLPSAAPAAGMSLQELADEVECPNCGERQPKKFVLCRKCTTDIPRALENKREEAERARAERQAARDQARGRFAPPKAEIDGESHYSGEVEPPPYLSLSFEGRFGRASYINTWGISILLICFGAVIAAMLSPLLGKLVLLPAGVGFIAYLIWSVRIGALRLHDFNRSGWWIVLLFIPYLGAVFNLVMLIWPGNAEENDYGPKPRRGNIVLTIVVFVLLVVGVGILAAVALPAYQSYVKRAQQQAQQTEQTEQHEADQEQRPMPRMPAGPAAQAFADQYMNAANEKAFAMSSAGAYGWGSGKATTREAVSAALSDCETRREPYTSQCRIVNVNGMSPKNR